MPKQFYTEKDIEDLFRSGRKSLPVTDDIVLTELAYEKAKQLGFQLVTERADIPPAAPIRPYLSTINTPHAAPATAPVASTDSPTATAKPKVLPIEQRIRSAVMAKVGNQVDARLLDIIIHRVVKGIGLK